MADAESELEALRRRIAELEAKVASAERAEHALAETEERFRVAFMTAPFAVTIARASDSRYLWVNPGFCALSGWSEAEAVGKTLVELGIFADEKELVRIHTEVVTKGYVENDVFRFGRKDGSVGAGLLSSRPIVVNGEPCQLGILHDLTTWKRTEAERDALHERLRQAQKLEAVGRLAGGLAHDFNNLLTVITTNVSLGVMDVAEGDPSRPLFEDIGQAAWRAGQLTRQLLAFSRKQVLQPRSLDLAELVGGLESMLRRLVPEDMQLVFTRGAAPAVLADPGQVEQVLVNLVVNARDALRPGGRIEVTTRAATDDERAAHPGRTSVLTVSDDGPGIPPEVRERIFEPFFTTKAELGTGLGLSMVDGIVRQHGGAVEVATAPGEGTTFRVLLPPSGTAPTHAEAPVTSSPQQRSGVVLLVEDDAAVREPMRQLLERLGYAVLVAADGRTALERSRSFPSKIDVLVTDVVMPGPSGREVAAAVQRERPEAVVVFVSGYSDERLGLCGVLEPDLVLLRKPFDVQQLANAIDHATARRRRDTGS